MYPENKSKEGCVLFGNPPDPGCCPDHVGRSWVLLVNASEGVRARY